MSERRRAHSSKEKIATERVRELLTDFAKADNTPGMPSLPSAKNTFRATVVSGALLAGHTPPAAAAPPQTIEHVLKDYERTHARLNDHDIAELALNVLHEAAGEPYKGRLAVAQVTIARALSGRREFGDGTISGTVRKKNQFSWTLEPLKAYGFQKDTHTLSEIERTLRVLLKGATKEVALQKLASLTMLPEDCHFYKRTDWDETKMSKRTAEMFAKLKPVAVIGNHTFYRE